MAYVFQHDLSPAAMLVTIYGALLCVLTLRTAVPSSRPVDALDFAILLTKLEPVWPMDFSFVNSQRSARTNVKPSLTMLEAQESLRRMSSNAVIFRHLALFTESDAGPDELAMAREISKKSICLRVYILVLRTALLSKRHIPGNDYFLKLVSLSYWAVVDRLQSLYIRYHSGHSAALMTACNLTG